MHRCRKFLINFFTPNSTSSSSSCSFVIISFLSPSPAINLSLPPFIQPTLITDQKITIIIIHTRTMTFRLLISSTGVVLQRKEKNWKNKQFETFIISFSATFNGSSLFFITFTINFLRFTRIFYSQCNEFLVHKKTQNHDFNPFIVCNLIIKNYLNVDESDEYKLQISISLCIKRKKFFTSSFIRL